jgi:hypothetical protein
MIRNRNCWYGRESALQYDYAVLQCDAIALNEHGIDTIFAMLLWVMHIIRDRPSVNSFPNQTPSLSRLNKSTR